MTTLHNRTRTSESIPRRLLREGKVHLLPVYAVMRLSDLAREGIENSGSYQFADHVYRNEPSGRFGIGRALDAVLLRMRGARSMRNRFLHTQREIVAAARTFASRAATPFRVLSIPCGIARDLVLAARQIEHDLPEVYARSTFFGVDLDPAPLGLSRELAREISGSNDHFVFAAGDALDANAFPPDLDVVVSTGLGEFLDDDLLVRFFANCHDHLRGGGTFVTSAMQPDRVADYLMRQLAELHTHYRRGDEIIRWLHEAGYYEVSTRQDDVGLQTLVVARKRAHRSTPFQTATPNAP